MGDSMDSVCGKCHSTYFGSGPHGCEEGPVKKKVKVKLSTLSKGEKVARAVKILMGYDDRVDVSAEHDEIWLSTKGNKTALGIDAPDEKRMRWLGFSWDKGNDAWHSFV